MKIFYMYTIEKTLNLPSDLGLGVPPFTKECKKLSASNALADEELGFSAPL